MQHISDLETITYPKYEIEEEDRVFNAHIDVIYVSKSSSIIGIHSQYQLQLVRCKRIINTDVYTWRVNNWTLIVLQVNIEYDSAESTYSNLTQPTVNWKVPMSFSNRRHKGLSRLNQWSPIDLERCVTPFTTRISVYCLYLPPGHWRVAPLSLLVCYLLMGRTCLF